MPQQSDKASSRVAEKMRTKIATAEQNVDRIKQDAENKAETTRSGKASNGDVLHTPSAVELRKPKINKPPPSDYDVPT